MSVSNRENRHSLFDGRTHSAHLRFDLLMFFILLISIFLFASDCGGLTPCNCGDAVIEDYTMADNLNCTDTALSIGADGVDLNCANFFIEFSSIGFGYGVNATDKVGISVKNCFFYQQNTSVDVADLAAIRLNNTNFSTIDNVTITVAETNAFGILVTRNSHSNTMTFANITTTGSSSPAISFEPISSLVFNNTISNSSLYTYSNSFPMNIYATLSSTCANNSFFNLTLNTSGSSAVGLYALSISSAIIMNNTFRRIDVVSTGSSSHGIQLTGASNTITYNTFVDMNINTTNTNAYKIIIYPTNTNNIAQNTFANMTFLDQSEAQVRVGFSTYRSGNNFLLNITGLNKSAISYGGADARNNITVQWYARVNVTDMTDTAMDAVSVSSTNNQSITQSFGNTAADGNTSWFVMNDTLFRGAGGDIVYSTHKFTASKTGYATNSTNETINVSKTVHIYLDTPNAACEDTISSDLTLNTDLNCSGTALILGADSITLDCAGHTIGYALFVNGSAVNATDRFNVTIKNCNILQQNGTITLAWYDTGAINFNRTNFSTIQDVSIRTMANNSHGISMTNSLSNNVTSVVAHTYGGVSVPFYIESSFNGSFSNLTANSTIDWSTGFYVWGSSNNSFANWTANTTYRGLEIIYSDNNTFSDMLIDSGDYGIEFNSGNNNTFKFIKVLGRGMIIEFVYNNHFSHFNITADTGIFLYISAPEYNDFYNFSITTTSSDQSRGIDCENCRNNNFTNFTIYTRGYRSPGMFFDMADHNIFTNFTITTVNSTSSGIELMRSFNLSFINFMINTTEVTSPKLLLGDIFGFASSCYNITIVNSTFLGQSRNQTFFASSSGEHAGRNYLINITNLNRSAILYDSGDNRDNVTVQWYARVNVTDMSDVALDAVTVSSVNNQSITQAFGNTAADGNTSWVLVNDTMFRGSGGDILYSTHKFTASKTGYVTNSTNETINESKTVHIYMDTPNTACGDTLTENKTLNCDLNCSDNGLIIGANDLILDCAGHTIEYARISEGNGISIKNHNNVTIRNCSIIQQNSSFNNTPGMNGTFIYQANTVSISNSTFSTKANNSMCVASVDSTYLDIANISMSSTGRNTDGLNFENVNYSRITSINATSSGNTSSGINIFELYNFTFSGIFIETGDSSTCINGDYIYNSTFSNVTLQTAGNNSEGLWIEDCENNTFSFFDMNISGTALIVSVTSLIYCDRNIVYNFSIYTLGTALYLEDSDYNRISNFTIFTGNVGVYMYFSNNNSISNFKIDDLSNITYGIYFEAGSTYNNFSNFNINLTKPSSIGIYLDAPATGCVFSDFNISANSSESYGVYFYFADNVTATRFMINTTQTSSPKVVFKTLAYNNTLANSTFEGQSINQTYLILTTMLGSNFLLNISQLNRSAILFKSAVNTLNVTVQWYVRVNVTDLSGNAISGASVSSVNNQSITQDFGTTQDDGNTSWVVMNDTMFRGAGGDILYSTHQFTGSKTGYLTNSTNETINSSMTVHIYMDTPNAACGDTISSDLTLNLDLNCSTTGLIFGADDITLDCAGHYIEFARIGVGNGIEAKDRRNIIIKNCRIFQQNNTFNNTAGMNGTFFFNTNSSFIYNTSFSSIANRSNAFSAYNSKLNNIFNISQTTLGKSAKGTLLYNSSNNILSNISISTNGYGAFSISIDPGSNFNNLSNFFISTIGLYADGITLDSCSNNILSNFSILTNGESAYGSSLYPGSNFNNLSNFSILTSGFYAYGAYLDSSSNNTFSNFSITTNGSYSRGVYIDNSSNNTFSNFSITTNGSNADGTYLGSSSNNALSNFNISTNGSSAYGVWFDSSSNNALSNFNISTNGSTARGVRLASSSNNTLTNFSIFTIGSSAHGIYLESSSNNILSNFKINTTQANTPKVYFYSSSNNTISNSTFFGQPTNQTYMRNPGENILLNITNLNSSAFFYYTSPANTWNVTVQWYARVNVTDMSDVALDAVTVSSVNNQSITQAFGNTAADGNTSWVLVNDTMFRGSGGDILYSTHQFTASKTGYATNSTNQTINSSMTVGVKLGATECGMTIYGDLTMDSDLNCTGSALKIGADNVVLDCAGHIIEFARLENGTAIWAYGRNNITVKNCIILQQNTSGDLYDLNGSFSMYTNFSTFDNISMVFFDDNSYGFKVNNSNSNRFSNLSIFVINEYGGGDHGGGIIIYNSTNSTYRNIFVNGTTGLDAIYLNYNVSNSSFYNITCNGSGWNFYCLRMEDKAFNNSFVKFNSTIGGINGLSGTDTIWAENEVYNNSFINFTINNSGYGIKGALDIGSSFTNNTLINFDIYAQDNDFYLFFTYGSMNGNKLSNFNIVVQGDESNSPTLFQLSNANYNTFSNFTINSNFVENILSLSDSSSNTFYNFSINANDTSDYFSSEYALIYSTDSSFNKFILINLTTVNLTGIIFSGTQLNHFRHNLSEVYINNVLARHYATGYSLDCPTSPLNFSNASYLGFAGCSNVVLENTTASDVILYAFGNNSIIRHSNVTHDGSGFWFMGRMLNNTFSNLTVTGADGKGVYVFYRSNDFINNSFSFLNVSMPTGTPLSIDGDSGASINNNFSHVNLYLASNTDEIGGAYLYQTSNITIHNITSLVEGIYSNALYLDTSTNNKIDSFNFTNTGSYACCIGPTNGAYVLLSSNNSFSNGFINTTNSEVYKIYISYSMGNNFSNITFLGPKPYQTYVYGTSSNGYSGSNQYINMTNLNRTITFEGTSSNRNNLTIQWYARLNITKTDGTGLEGASGNFTNNQSRTGEMSSATGGLTAWAILNDTMFRHSGGNILYTMHNFTANKTNYITNSTNETVNQSMTIHLQLPLGATPVSCGDLINESITMANDLNCIGTGLIINNDSVELDCAGHYINYSITNSGNGIEAKSRLNVTIKNCFIYQHNSSLRYNNSNSTLFYSTNFSKIENVTIQTKGNLTYGIMLFNANGNNVSFANISTTGYISYAIYATNRSQNSTLSHLLLNTTGEYAPALEISPYYEEVDSPLNISIYNVTAYTYGDESEGILLNCERNTTIANVTVNTYGSESSGIYMGCGWTGFVSDTFVYNATVFIHGDADWMGSGGIRIHGGEQLHVYNATITTYNSSPGLYSDQSRDSLYDDITINTNGSEAFGITCESWWGICTGNNFSNIRISTNGSRAYGIHLDGWEDNFHEINITTVNASGIYFYQLWNGDEGKVRHNFTNVTIEGREVMYYEPGYSLPCPSSPLALENKSFVLFGECNNVVLENSTIFDSLIFAYSNNSHVANVSANAKGIALYLLQLENASFSNFNLTSSDSWADSVKLGGTSFGNFTNFTIYASGFNSSGIQLFYYSLFNRFNNISIVSTAQNSRSLYFEDDSSTGNLFTNGNINTTQNNAPKVYFGYSSNNTVANTTFLGQSSNQTYSGFDGSMAGKNYLLNITNLNSSAIRFQSASALNNLTVQWYGRVNVTDYNGNAINSASANFTNNQSRKGDLGTTAGGLTNWYVLNDTLFRGAGAPIVYSTTNFTANKTVGGITYINSTNATVNQSMTVNIRFGIPTCGMTLTQNTTLESDLNCSATGLIIGANDLILDCAGHAIEFARISEGNGIMAIGMNNITIKNCRIFQQNDTFNNTAGMNGTWLFKTNNSYVQNNSINVLANYSFGISILESESDVLSNNTIITMGYRGYANYLMGLSGFVFTNFTISTNGTSAYGAYLYNSSDVSLSNFTVSTNGSSARGIQFSRSNSSSLSGSSITTNGSNAYGFFCSNSTNLSLSNSLISTNGSGSIGIDLFPSCANSAFSNLTIRTFGPGLRGIYLFTSSSNNTFNNFSISTLYEDATGLFVNAESLNNNFTSFTISTNGSDSYGLRIESSSSNNSFSNFSISTNGTGAWGAMLGVDTYYNSFSNFTIKTFGSSAIGAYLWAGFNYNSLSNFTISTNNSLAYGIHLDSSSNNSFISGSINTTSADSPKVFYYDTALPGSANNTIANCTFLGQTANQTYIVNSGDNLQINLTNFNRSAVNYNSSPSAGWNLTIQWYARVNVTDNSGNAISGATVNSTNNQSITQDLGTTQNDGNTSWFIMNDTMFRGAGGNINYLLHNFTAGRSGYSTNSTNATINASKTVNVVLGFGTSVSCGDLINESIVMANDLNCPSTALTVNNDSVTLDCGGHYINFSMVSKGNAIQAINRTNITIKNCVIYQRNASLFQYYSNGTYLFNTNYSIIENVTFSIDGRTIHSVVLLNSSFNNATDIWINTTYNSHGAYLSTSSHNILDNFTIFANSSSSYPAYLRFSANNTLRNFNVSALLSPGLMIEGFGLEDFQHNITEYYDNGGLVYYYADGYSLPCPSSPLNFSNVSLLGFAGCRNLRLENTTINDMLLLAFVNDSAITNVTNTPRSKAALVMNVSNNSFSHVFVNASGAWISGYEVNRSNSNSFLNFTFLNVSFNQAFSLWGCSNNSVENFSINIVYGSQAMNLRYSHNNTLKNISIIASGEMDGIWLSYSHDNSVHGVSMIGNVSYADGILAEYSQRNLFDNCSFSLNGTNVDALMVGGGGYSNFSSFDCNVSGDTAIGIILESDDNRFSNFNVRTNSSLGLGIYCEQAYDNLLENFNVTTFGSNSYGFEFLACYRNNATFFFISTQNASSPHLYFVGSVDNIVSNSTYYGQVLNQTYLSYVVGSEHGPNFLLNMTNLNKSAIRFYSSLNIMNITVQWYARVNVTDSSGNAISGATVNSTNNQSITQDLGTTQDDGNTSWFIMNDTLFRGSGGNINYLLHNFTVRKSGYGINSTNATINTSTTVNIYLLPPSCGDTITENITLTQDQNCSGTAFIIGANDLIFDCAGHTIEYARITRGNGFNVSGRNNVTLKNCMILQQNTSMNVDLANATYIIYSNNSLFENITILTREQYASGVIMERSQNNTFSFFNITTFGSDSYALYVTNSSRNDTFMHFSINTSGDDSIGLATGGYDLWSNTLSFYNFSITTFGLDSWGVETNYAPSTNFTNFTIKTYNAIGFDDGCEYGDGCRLTNITITTYGNGNSGIGLNHLTSGSVMTNLKISTYGDSADALYVNGGQTSNYSNFEIFTNGSYSHALKCTSPWRICINNIFTNFNITTNNSHSYGIYMIGAFTCKFQNFNISTRNSSSIFLSADLENEEGPETLAFDFVNVSIDGRKAYYYNYEYSSLGCPSSPINFSNASFVGFGNCSNVILENSTIYDTLLFGFAPNSRANNITINSKGYGLVLEGTNNASFSNSTINFSGNNFTGVYALSSSNNTFSDFSINNSDRFSPKIHIFYTSDNNTFINPVFYGQNLNHTYLGGLDRYDSPSFASSIFILNATNFNKSAVTFDTADAQNNITIQWYARVNVTNYDGNPINSASANYTNNQSRTGSLGTTASGLTNWYVLNDTLYRGAGAPIVYSTTNFTANKTISGATYINSTNATINETMTVNLLLGAPSCGMTLTQNTTLESDLNCSANGLIIGANDLILDCAGYTIEFSRISVGNGIAASGMNNVTIKNCIILQQNDTFNNTVGMNGTFLFRTNSSQIYNTSISTKANYSFALSVFNSKLNSFLNNSLITYGYKSYGTYLNASSSNNSLSNLSIATSGHEASGAYIFSSFNNSMFNFTITTNNGDSNGIDLKSSYNNSLANITIRTYGDSSFGIFLSKSSNNSLENFTITTGNGFGVGTILDESYNNSLSLFNISANGDIAYGVYLTSSSNNSLTNFTILTNGTQAYGVYVEMFSENNGLSNFTIASNGDQSHGVYFVSSQKNLLSSFKIITNGTFAMGVDFSDASNSTLAGFNITTSGSLSYGIYFSGSNNDTLSNFSIVSTYMGISLSSSDNNSFTNFSINTSAIDSPKIKFLRGSDNIFSNITFLGQAINQTYIRNPGKNTFLNITGFNHSALSYYASPANTWNVTVQWYVRVNVTDASGTGLEGAGANYTNNQSITGDMGTTTGGLTSWFVMNDTLFRGAGGDILYSIHNFTANKTGYLTNSTNETVNGSKTINLRLEAENAACGQTIMTNLTLNIDLNCSGTGLIIGANDLILDCAGHYIEFARISTGNGIQAVGRNNISIKNCIILQQNTTGSKDDSNGTVLFLTNSSLIQNNTIRTAEDWTIGLYVMNCSNNAFIKMNVSTTGAYSNGVFLHSSANNSLSNFTVSTKISAYGTHLWRSFNNTLLQFEIAANGTDTYGASLWWSSNNTYSNFTISTNGTSAYGLFPWFSDSNNYSNFTVSTNGSFAHGAYVKSSNSNSFSVFTVITNGSNASGVLLEFAFFNSLSNFSSTTKGISARGGYLYFSSNNSLSNFRIFTSQSGAWGFFLQTSSNNSLTNITILTNGSNANGIYANSSSNNSMHDLTIITNGSSAIGLVLSVNSSSNSIAKASIFTNGSSAYGLYTYYSDNNSISNFTISTNGSGSHGIILSRSSNNSLTNFSINANGSSSLGAYLSFSPENNLSNFTLSTFGASGHGIFLFSSNSNVLSNFTSFTNGSDSYGIAISGSSNNSLSNFSIETNGSSACGAYVSSSSHFNSLSNFIINTSGQSSSKIVFYGSSNNTLSNSTFLGQAVNQTYIQDPGQNILLNISNLNRSAIVFYTTPANSWNVTIQWYVRVNVTDINNIAISGASVNSTNNQSITQDLGTTQGDGNTNWFVMNDTLFRGAGGDILYSTTNFTANRSVLLNSTNATINSSMTVHIYLSESEAPSIMLISPANDTNFTVNSITFQCYAEDNYLLSNATLFIWNSTGSIYHNSTNSLSGASNLSSWTVSGMANGNYSYTCNGTDSFGNRGANGTLFNFSISSSPSPPTPDDEKKSMNVQIIANYSTNPITIIVQSEGLPLSNAFATLTLNSQTVSVCFTNEGGVCALTASTSGTYYVKIIRTGYYDFQSQVVLYSRECTIDSDCENDEQCIDYNCTKIIGECGYAKEHRWINYECCADSDCPDDKYCSGNSCKKVEGECGYISNHKWINYGCCKNSDCASGETCINNKCTQESSSGDSNKTCSSEGKKCGICCTGLVCRNGICAKESIVQPSGNESFNYTKPTERNETNKTINIGQIIPIRIGIKDACDGIIEAEVDTTTYLICCNIYYALFIMSVINSFLYYRKRRNIRNSLTLVVIPSALTLITYPYIAFIVSLGMFAYLARMGEVLRKVGD